MDHGSEPALGQQFVQPDMVGEVAHHKLGLLGAPAVTRIEIVINDGTVARVEQMADDEAADIPGTASDQHVQPLPPSQRRHRGRLPITTSTTPTPNLAPAGPACQLAPGA